MNRLATIAFLFIIAVVGGLLGTATRGGRAYFSPDTLELRTQTEITLLFGKLPIYRSSLDLSDNAVLTYIRDERFVAPKPTAQQRWLLVFHQNGAWKDGFTYLYLPLYSHRDSILEWCREDRQRAELYWSKGFRYLRSENPNEVALGEQILAHSWRYGESFEELKEEIAALEDAPDFK